MQELDRSHDSNNHGIADGVLSIGLVIGSIGVGALLMYLFDPDRGRGRRSQLRDQLTSKLRHAGKAAEAKARDLRNRAQGLVHEVSSILPGGDGEGDSNNQRANEASARARAAGLPA